MNSSTDPRTGLSLPRPSFDEALPSISGSSQQAQSAETLVPQITGQAPVAPEAMPAVRTSELPVPEAPKLEAPAANQEELESSVVDKEWIEKALETVERNRADPYQQSKELSRLKAEYIKARYNREIKGVED